jgi:urease gamma subunit
MNSNELLSKMFKEMKEDMPKCACTGIDSEGNFHFDIDEELFSKYFMHVDDSIMAMSPYGSKLIDLAIKHKNSVAEACKKSYSYLTKKAVMSGVTFVANLLGLTSLLDDSVSLVTEMIKDEDMRGKLASSSKDMADVFKKSC